MGLTWHPSNDLLAEYATGGLGESWCLVIASHLALCPHCRDEAAALDAIGGVALSELPVAPMSNSALDGALAALETTDQDTGQNGQKRVTHGIFPSPLWDYVGGDLDTVRWRSIGGRVRQCILPTQDNATARLLTIPPGAIVPEHAHTGQEMTLVLQGSVVDGDAVYQRGDVQQADAELTHTPAAGLGEVCICLLVTDGPLKFTGLVPKLAARFARL